MKKAILALFINIIVIPLVGGFIFFLMFMAPFIYDSIKYNRFQKNVERIYAESSHGLLDISVCHEWKCTFEYKDNRSKYKFLIFGEKNLEERILKLIEISSGENININKCRLIQKGSNICQI